MLSFRKIYSIIKLFNFIIHNRILNNIVLSVQDPRDDKYAIGAEYASFAYQICAISRCADTLVEVKIHKFYIHREILQQVQKELLILHQEMHVI